ncbi:acetyl-coenzyme A carboxylase carboxyl transferase subunit alpha, chloroplastic [Trifolium repens]|nr:acetyl-coenzyme A carboxylase carboxyl transferase subunit alpha, chloroplastic [Trifolium repens]
MFNRSYKKHLSPEACAAILWKTAKAAPKAAEKLKITAQELVKLQVEDGIIPEPIGGAHADPGWTSQQIKITIYQAMELTKLNTEDLKDRNLKFRKLGGFQEGIPVDPNKGFHMKMRDIPDKIEKLQADFNQGLSVAPNSNKLQKKLDMLIELKQTLKQSLAKAVGSSSLKEKYENIVSEISGDGSLKA